MNQKLKICYIVSSLANEGPVNVMYNIIKYIDFNKFDISVVSLIPEKENSRINDFHNLPINVVQLAEINSLSPLKLFFELKNKLKELKPAQVHSHCPRSLFLISFLPKYYKTIYTAHIYPGVQQKALYGSLKGEIIIRLSNYMMLKMDLPIACSESVSLQFKDLNGWKIKAINNGCSLPVWMANDMEKQKIREVIGLKNGVKYFIFIGRFSKEKKPDLIIESFLKLKDSSVGLIMLGNGPLYTALKLKETELIKVEGFKINVYEYLIASDFYISASETEGLANTLLESMTVGLPMLLSDIPSHNQIIEGTKESVGLLFNNSESINIINGIEAILKWSEPQISSNIRKYYKAKFTAQKMSEEYQKQYLSLSKN